MNELEKMLGEVKRTPRKKHNAEILDEIQQYIEGILDDAANKPELITADRGRSDAAHIMGLYSKLVHASFGKVVKHDKET